jgi:hypothetical protein
MAAGPYQIIDEPRPSPLSRFIVNPFWFLLAGMLLPSFILLAAAGFALNALALRGPTWKAELLWLAGVAVIVLGFVPAVAQLIDAGLIARADFPRVAPYLAILHSATTLAVMFRVFLYQSPSYQLAKYLAGLRA